MTPSLLPLAIWADRRLADLAERSGAPRVAALTGGGLMGERAALSGFAIPGTLSAGGGCRLYAARDGSVALNLSRPDDRDLLPALFETDGVDWAEADAVATQIARQDSLALTARGRALGLAIAAEHEGAAPGACSRMLATPPVMPPTRPPLVVDLSALWAGPLAAHLLGLAGARVVKAESRSRRDAMREGDPAFFALLNQDKASVVLDFRDVGDRAALLRLLAAADIVIEAARPRALLQLGIDAAEVLAAHPGQVWISVTGHGTEGEAAHWIGFGDDAGVAGGLTAALRRATGQPGFVGDAIADPLTGIEAARIAWTEWTAGRGGRYALAMSGIVALALAETRAADGQAFDTSLRRWHAAVGQPFPATPIRPTGPVAASGQDTNLCLETLATC